MAAGGLAGAALVGCGGGDEIDGEAPATGTTAATGTAAAGPSGGPVQGGTLRLNVRGDAPSWAITRASSDTASVTSHIYSALLRLKQGPGVGYRETTIVPDLATALPEQPDELTYTFTVRSDVKFQNAPPVDGRAMTIEDVVASIKLLTESSSFKNDYTDLNSVEAVDDTTVRVTTGVPNAPLLNNSAGHYGWRIVPTEIMEGDLAESNPVGTGPYIREAFEPGSRTVFRRNPDFFEPDRVHFDSMEFLVISQAASAVAAFRTGEIDLLSGQACQDTADVVEAMPEAGRHEAPGSSGWFAFNTTKPPFDDDRVRKAVALLYDREAETQALFCGHSEVPGIIPHDRALRPEDYMGEWLRKDVEEAKSLLSAAGYTDGFKTTAVWTPQYGQTYQFALERAIGDLRVANIEVEPISYEYGVWIKDIYRGSYDFDGILWGPGRYYPDVDPYVYYWLHPEGIANQSRVDDPGLTELIERQRIQLDPDARWETLHEIQRIEAEHMYYVWRTTGVADVLSAPWVTDYVPHAGYGTQELWPAWDNRLA